MMGINYSLHLGKRSSNGRDADPKCTFTYAVPPTILDVLLVVAECGEVTVTDEYGGTRPLHEFLTMIEWDRAETASVGMEFC